MNKTATKQWHSENIETIKKEFHTVETGLTFHEAENRLTRYGLNEITMEKKVSPLKILVDQFKDPLVIILLLAAAISGILGETIDATVISAIVIVSVILGLTQEYRAEKAAEALKKMVSPTAIVIRDGDDQQIDAKELVPGDVLKISAGDRIAGDARLFKVDSLQIDEAPLTGESADVEKETETQDRETPLADRRNMVYSGTVATYGKGLGIVVATGMTSEFGKIAGMLQEVEEEQTPLQRRMAEIGKWLIAVMVLVVSVVTGLGIVRGHELFEMFLWGVSLAVAAVPEALPAVVTGSLAIGMRQMAEQKAIVKKLPAVETLGSTTVICSDKTGTLTRGEMTVRKIYYSGETFNVEGSGYKPIGKIERIDTIQKSNLARIAALCNDSLLKKEKENYWIQGQPTEGALLVMAMKIGESPEQLRKEFPRIAEIPFSSERKRMTTIHRRRNKKITAAMKGAPEIVLNLCNKVEEDGEIKTLGEGKIQQILNMNSELARRALRVIALAYKELPSDQKEFSDEDETNFIFIGLVGMIDPPREKAKDSIRQCKKAGIRVIMITGDNKLTALSIAKELDITSNDEVIDGPELSKMSEEELRKHLDHANVFARVSPEHKMRIVRILKEEGEIVAVTGDGVNDAPALKNSDIGVAMGITGTEVTKEASDLVLIDDNFSTIVSAVERGRGTFDNIKKYLSFLLSANTGEILVMFIAGLVGLPLPLIALQILWVNLVTDGLPAMALGVDPAEPDVMERPPRSPKASVFDRGVQSLIFVVGIIMAMIGLVIFNWYLHIPSSTLVKSQTMVFTYIVILEMVLAFNFRSTRYSLTKINPFKNIYLILAVTSSIILQLFVIYTPALNEIFSTTALNLQDWVIIIVATIPATISVEITKKLNEIYR